MGRGQHNPEQIVNILRQIELAIANGKMTPTASREAGITEQTYYRANWSIDNGARGATSLSGPNDSILCGSQ
jgi:hypothetical protein